MNLHRAHHLRRHRERGFSLVEALIALAIVAGTTAMLYATIGQDARTRRAADERRIALALARSALDRAGAGDPASEGRWHDLSWHVAREPYTGPGGASDPFDPAPLERISVTVTDARRLPLLSLATVRIRP